MATIGCLCDCSKHCAMVPPDVTAPSPLAGHAVAANWLPHFLVAGVPVSTTGPRVTVDWISTTDHYIAPGSCRPHCHNNQWDTQIIRESYPANLENDAFGLLCREWAQSDNRCDFEYQYSANDRTRHIVSIRWPTRPDDVWFTLIAYY